MAIEPSYAEYLKGYLREYANGQLKAFEELAETRELVDRSATKPLKDLNLNAIDHAVYAERASILEEAIRLGAEEVISRLEADVLRRVDELGDEP